MAATALSCCAMLDGATETKSGGTTASLSVLCPLTSLSLRAFGTCTKGRTRHKLYISTTKQQCCCWRAAHICCPPISNTDILLSGANWLSIRDKPPCTSCTPPRNSSTSLESRLISSGAPATVPQVIDLHPQSPGRTLMHWPLQTCFALTTRCSHRFNWIQDHLAHKTEMRLPSQDHSHQVSCTQAAAHMPRPVTGCLSPGLGMTFEMVFNARP